MADEHNLGDIEGAIQRHYDKMDSEGGNIGDSPLVIPAGVPQTSFDPNLPILGGHEDHDHAPIVINPPFIIFQYGVDEAGNSVFNLNTAGIDGGILGMLAQAKETVAFLENEIAEGNISVTDQE